MSTGGIAGAHFEVIAERDGTAHAPRAVPREPASQPPRIQRLWKVPRWPARCRRPSTLLRANGLVAPGLCAPAPFVVSPSTGSGQALSNHERGPSTSLGAWLEITEEVNGSEAPAQTGPDPAGRRGRWSASRFRGKRMAVTGGVIQSPGRILLRLIAWRRACRVRCRRLQVDLRPLSRYCQSCRNELEEGANFCTGCGARVVASAVPEAEAKGPETGTKARTDYAQFLTIDASRGFVTIVVPALMWSSAACVLAWAIIGLVSLRFNIADVIQLSTLFLSMLVMVGIVACVIVNYYLILQHRARDESIQRALTYTPVVWGSLTCVGLVIIIPQMWAGFYVGAGRAAQVDGLVDWCWTVRDIRRIRDADSDGAKANLRLHTNDDLSGFDCGCPGDLGCHLVGGTGANRGGTARTVRQCRLGPLLPFW